MVVKKPVKLQQRRDIAALLNPRNIVIVGASDKPGNWAERSWNNLQRYGFKGGGISDKPGAGDGLGQQVLPDVR